jgi:hypothetical protein
MSFSRRRFLQHGVLAVAACAAAPLEAWGGSPSNGHNHDLSQASFAGLIGSSFKVTGKGIDAVWLRLSAVQDLPANPAATTPSLTSGFTVSFSGPGTNLPQGTYTFENDQLGSFSLFIVPGEGSYTAVFNQLNAPNLAHAGGHSR